MSAGRSGSDDGDAGTVEASSDVLDDDRDIDELDDPDDDGLEDDLDEELGDELSLEDRILEDEDGPAGDDDVPLPGPVDVALDEDDDDDEPDVAILAEELEDEDEGLREGEFICTSCHLVKGPSQLASARRRLCVDCV